MPTLWFSYSLPGGSLDVDEPLSSPYTISWHVGRFLREWSGKIGYDFRYVNLDDTTPQTFSPDDIAIGHTWFSGGFMHQALDANIKGKFILQPYSHAMVSEGDIKAVIALWSKADRIFAITGEYWWHTMRTSPYGNLQAIMTRLDMAVNVEKHPYMKTNWNKPGERAVCVIGHDTPTKGYANVAELARVAGFRLGHFGSGDGKSFEHVPCFTAHGGHLFTPDVIAWVCQNYDAVMAMPEADANPTILLEAAAWGLTVFSANEAGNTGDEMLPVRMLKKGDLAGNVQAIRQWQHDDEYTLVKESEHARRMVQLEYNWRNFCNMLWYEVKERL